MFVALRPPDDVLDYVEAVVSRARRAMIGPRWTARDQWHVTVHFFGNLDDDGVTRALKTLAYFSKCAPFTLSLDCAGAFASERRARVLWLSARDGLAFEEMLAGYMLSLAALGYAVEDLRQLHLTVARLRVASPAHEALRAMREVIDELGPAPPWRVTEAALYESDLRKDGARYTMVERVLLAADQGA